MMYKGIKKIKPAIAALAAIVLVIISVAIPAKEALAAAEYAPLTTIPGATVACTPGPNGDTGFCVKADPVKIIKNIYGISIGIAAILAVAMIIWAGILYATTEAISGKSAAKDHWQGALWGLLLLLSSYLILQTINVELVNIDLGLGKPVECTVIDANGVRQPCSGLSSNPLQTLMNSLQREIATQNTLVAEKTESYEDAKQAVIEAEARGDAEEDIQALEATRDRILRELTLAQEQSTRTGAYTSAGNIVEVQTKGFDNITDETLARQKFDYFNKIAAELFTEMRNQKNSEGKSLYTPDELSKIQSEMLEQRNYMSSYINWLTARNQAVFNEMPYNEPKPTQPLFEIPPTR